MNALCEFILEAEVMLYIVCDRTVALKEDFTHLK